MEKNTISKKRCTTISIIQKMIGGKWKIEILYYIAFENIHRFGELHRNIDGIAEGSLMKQLRELETDGFLHRHDYQEVPPHVEYTLTTLGKSFIPILEHMKQWGKENNIL